MKVVAIVTLVAVMGSWALILSLMVHYRMKYKAETRELENDTPPSRYEYIEADGPEIDLSGDDDNPTPRYFGNDEVFFEHI